MRFAYLDESGTSIHESVTVVAAVIVKADKQWKQVEKYLNRLVEKYIPEEGRHGFVFHATDLFHGSGAFRRDKYPIDRAHAALKEILAIPSMFGLALAYGVSIKKSKVDKDSTSSERRRDASHHHAGAYGLCVTAVESYMRQFAGSQELATLVAEYNTDTQNFVDRMHYVLRGLDRSENAEALRNLISALMPDCLPIGRIVDHVHFTRKRDATMLQVADACAFTIRCYYQKKSNAREFFDALTLNKPDSLLIGEGKHGGYSLIPFPPTKNPLGVLIWIIKTKLRLFRRRISKL